MDDQPENLIESSGEDEPLSNGQVIPAAAPLLLQNTNCTVSSDSILDTIESYNNWNVINTRDNIPLCPDVIISNDTATTLQIPPAPAKVKVGDKFNSFEELKKAVLEAYPYQGIRLKQKQYRKSGDRHGFACRWTFVCKCAGTPKPKGPSAKVRKSVKTGCQWHVTAWWPESQDGPHISKMETIHTGHEVLSEAELRKYAFGDDIRARSSEIEAFLSECLSRGDKLTLATEEVRQRFFPSKEFRSDAVHATHSIYNRLRKAQEKLIELEIRTITQTQVNGNPTATGTMEHRGNGGLMGSEDKGDGSGSGSGFVQPSPMHALLDACLPSLAQFTERLSGAMAANPPVLYRALLSTPVESSTSVPVSISSENVMRHDHHHHRMRDGVDEEGTESGNKRPRISMESDNVNNINDLVMDSSTVAARNNPEEGTSSSMSMDMDGEGGGGLRESVIHHVSLGGSNNNGNSNIDVSIVMV
eukprot:gene11606-24302_t